jgi:hypothetical protein
VCLSVIIACGSLAFTQELESAEACLSFSCSSIDSLPCPVVLKQICMSCSYCKFVPMYMYLQVCGHTLPPDIVDCGPWILLSWLLHPCSGQIMWDQKLCCCHHLPRSHALVPIFFTVGCILKMLLDLLKNFKDSTEFLFIQHPAFSVINSLHC